MPKMEIKTIEISKINPAKYNPRLDLQPGDSDYEKLKKSMQEFDLVEPLVWNKRSGNLIGGHQRLKILIKQGKIDVEVSVVDLSDSKEKALNLALNKISGDWDLPKLKDLLQELDTGEFDMEIAGFDDKEIEDLMTQFYEPDEKEDEVPEVPEEPITKLGDLYRLGEHRLLCGDATKINDVERLMDGQKADMVFTDPPYGINYSGGRTQVVKKKDYGKLINDDLSGNDLGSLIRLIFYQDAEEIYICVSPLNMKPFLDEIENNGKIIDAVIVWNKGNIGLGYMKYRRQCEFILYLREIPFSKSDNSDTDYWEIGKDFSENYIHGTQKPVALSERAIFNSSKLNNIVLDLFGGSGSTLIACEKLNRKCYMMEIDPHYCDVIKIRYEDYTGKKAEMILNG